MLQNELEKKIIVLYKFISECDFEYNKEKIYSAKKRLLENYYVENFDRT